MLNSTRELLFTVAADQLIRRLGNCYSALLARYIDTMKPRWQVPPDL
jgi:hypothetical protein